jgi:hypothetical protein
MRRIVALAFVAGLSGPALAATANVTVGGNASPFLAGQPSGTNCCSGTTAPADSPVLVPLTLTAGTPLTFSATGSVSNVGGSGPGTADGADLFSMNGTYGTGISGAQNIWLNALVGVFLDNSVPSGSGPASLDFSSGLNFASLTPGIGQIFFIGDGLTGTGTGGVQQFYVPTGATRLFLGTSDGYEWQNNSGSFRVTVDAAGGVPEPASWAMMVGGFGLIGAAMRRRQRADVTFA